MCQYLSLSLVTRTSFHLSTGNLSLNQTPAYRCYSYRSSYAWRQLALLSTLLYVLNCFTLSKYLCSASISRLSRSFLQSSSRCNLSSLSIQSTPSSHCFASLLSNYSASSWGLAWSFGLMASIICRRVSDLSASHWRDLLLTSQLTQKWIQIPFSPPQFSQVQWSMESPPNHLTRSILLHCLVHFASLPFSIN